MQNPFVSVIVPIYMIDRYVGICIESILNQTYKHIEVILVDDGSKDRCPEICDLYASKDSRIKVIHKPNGGLVSARKAGLRQSCGVYVTYVDGDDWIGPGFIEALVTAASVFGADMVCAGQTRNLFTKSVHFSNPFPAGIYQGEKLIELWQSMMSYGSFYRPGISTYVWNKLFKREIVMAPQLAVDNRISIGEDGAVTYPALLACKTVAVTDNVAYHYRQREDSMLKQSAVFSQEAQKLKYLYDYLMKWAATAPPKYGLTAQATDYVLSICLMRSGGRLPQDTFSTFDKRYYGKNVFIYSAGTFGQQLINRFNETGHCKVIAWIDDDYWEYRRCCLNVDPVETITQQNYDYVLIATVNTELAEEIRERLLDYGVSGEKILQVSVPKERAALLASFLDVANMHSESENKLKISMTHA